MGAKTWMLVYSTNDASKALAARQALDREASARLAAALFPRETLEPLPDGDLGFTSPPEDEVLVACYPGVAVIATRELAIDIPSQLPKHFLDAAPHRVVQLHAMHSVVDWLAFAVWHDGVLQRSLSVSPDSGVIEDLGPRLSFEEPFWNGEHPADDPDEELDEEDRYPLPFHPLEMGEAALREFFGYNLEGPIDPDLLEPETVPLLRFRRGK